MNLRLPLFQCACSYEREKADWPLANVAEIACYSPWADSQQRAAVVLGPAKWVGLATLVDLSFPTEPPGISAEPPHAHWASCVSVAISRRVSSGAPRLFEGASVFYLLHPWSWWREANLCFPTIKFHNVPKCRAGSKEYIAKSILFCFNYLPDGNV